METIKKTLIEPIKNNMTSVFFWGGLFLIFTGSIFGKTIDSFYLIPQGTGEFLLKTGGAVLGAGVFAAIMKSSQFCTIFQQHIYDVIYDPEKVKERISIDVRWRSLTNAIMREFMPESYSQVVNKIESQFFNSDLQYHLEDHNVTFDIVVDHDTKQATVTQTTETKIILAPNAKEPHLVQSISTGGCCDSIRFIINNKPIDMKQHLSVEGNESKINLPLKMLAVKNDTTGEHIVRLKRIAIFKQDLEVEPQIEATISRYIKGATVNARITDGYDIVFSRFGLGAPEITNFEPDDGLGYRTWVLAESNDLLLPGQGYILILIPKKGGM